MSERPPHAIVAPTTSKVEPWIFGLTLASASVAMVSIAASQTLGVLACLLWAFFRPRGIKLPSYFTPVFVFMATTLLSLSMSPEPGRGRAQINKFVLFLMGLLATNFVTNKRRARLSMAILISVSTASTAVALVQFAFRYRQFTASRSLADDPTVLARTTGFMSHWMTYSGEQLLVWCAAIPSIAVLGARWIVPICIVGVGIILSFTRSAWLGAASGLASIAVTLPRRILLSMLLPLGLVVLVSSGLIYHRIAMSATPEFKPDTGRILLLKVGVQMVRDHPLFGVGPERVYREFPKYAGDADLTDIYYGHLENNFMQIAAERGLLCLAAFVWLMVRLYSSFVRFMRSGDPALRTAALSATAALTGFLVAGLFSYDFGDSEVLMLLLFIVSIPFGLSLQAEQS